MSFTYETIFSVKQIPLPTNRTVAKADPPKKEPTNQPEIKQAPAAANNKDQKPEKSNKKEKKVKQSAADGGKQCFSF